MIIREAVESDKEGIGKLLSICYNIEDENEGAKAFCNEMKRGHNFIIYEEGGKIIGLVSWLSCGLPKHGLAELDRICVHPDFRGKGVSSRLFSEMLAAINKYYKTRNSKLRKLYVLTHKTNERAQRFYKKMGFSHETVLKSHYYDGVDECVMSMFFDEG